MILPTRDCPFRSGNKISRKSKQVHENFPSQNIFRDSKKIYTYIYTPVFKNVAFLKTYVIYNYAFSALASFLSTSEKT